MTLGVNRQPEANTARRAAVWTYPIGRFVLPGPFGWNCWIYLLLPVRYFRSGRSSWCGMPRRWTDSHDPPLAEAGKRRAEALARHLRDAGVGAIYTTEFQRTKKTVEPLEKILKGLGCDKEIALRFDEYDSLFILFPSVEGPPVRLRLRF